MQIRRFSASFLGTLVLAGLLDFASARAATFTVTKTADTNDGTCDSDCSLREAIIAANGTVEQSTIVIPAGTYLLTIPGRDEDACATGDLDITASVVLQGSAAGPTIIDGNGLDRVLDILSPATAVEIRRVELRGGYEDGGGIRVDSGETLVADSTISGNWAGAGGGILVNSGEIVVADSTISGNWATGVGVGGGILVNSGEILVADSTISGNLAEGNFSWGGGVAVSSAGHLTLTRSTVSANFSNGGGGIGFGGGISNQGTLAITNSTISGNASDSWHFGVGGGICAFSGSTTSLVNVTLSDNMYGGGIYAEGEVSLANTLLDDGCNGVSPVSLGGNLESHSDTCGLVDPTDQTNVPNAMIGSLADYGGPTETHALLAGSPAIDRALAANCPATDQRGVSRPQGSACDVGAFEREFTCWWCGSADLGSGWRWFSWFGYFNVNSDPWINHNELGWMYAYASDTGSLRFQSLKLGGEWLWTSDSAYPYLYRFSDSAWLWYSRGTSAPCWFYNLNTAKWERH